MAVKEVYIPERKSALQSLWGMAGNIGQGVGMFNTFKGMFGGGGAAGGTNPSAMGTNTPVSQGSQFNPSVGGGSTTSAAPVTEAGQATPYATTSAGGSPAATGSGGGAAGGESMWASAGPVAIGTGAMAFGVKAQGDYMQKGDKAGNAPYASKGGPSIKPSSWGFDTISRRSESMRSMNPRDLIQARDSISMLPLDEDTKSNMSKKIGEALNFAKFIKV